MSTPCLSAIVKHLLRDAYLFKDDDAGPTSRVHVVIKLDPNFPNKCRQGGDLDILFATRDGALAFERHLVDRFNMLESKAEFELGRTAIRNGHIHLDLFYKKRLWFRFDLMYDATKCYKRVHLHPEFARNVVSNWILVRVDAGDGETSTNKEKEPFRILVPNDSDECALRYLEFLDHIDTRPDKRKHLDYIMQRPDVLFRRPYPNQVDYNNLYTEPDEIESEDEIESKDNASQNEHIRYDTILVWHTGNKYLRDICRVLRDYPCFEIRQVRRLQVDEKDMEEFIKQVYALDPLPMEHLHAKTAYLKKPKTIVSDVYSILIRNTAREPYKTLVEAKITIRSMFNPPFANRKKRVNPLPMGVSHEHVIHASDNEREARQVLLVMGDTRVCQQGARSNSDVSLATIFDAVPNVDVGGPYHMSPYKTYETRYVLPHLLRVNLSGGTIVPIKETPHYEFVKGHRGPYEAYHSRYVGVTLTDDHFPHAFDLLVRFFDLEKAQPIVCTPDLRILDGSHRAAIWCAHYKDKPVQVCIPKF